MRRDGMGDSLGCGLATLVGRAEAVALPSAGLDVDCGISLGSAIGLTVPA